MSGSVPRNVSSLLPRLTSLVLDKTDVSGAFADVAAVTRLQHLGLPESFSGTLAGVLGNLTNLQTLVLFGRNMSPLPSDVGLLTALTLLEASDNNLVHVPTQIGLLTKLLTLDLSANPMVTLPSQIGQITALRTLRLLDTNLTLAALPSAVRNLTQTGTQIKFT